MEKTKVYWRSKSFWGMTLSLVGFVATIVSGYFGQDVTEYVLIAGKVLEAFGIPLAFYGRLDASTKLTAK